MTATTKGSPLSLGADPEFGFVTRMGFVRGAPTVLRGETNLGLSQFGADAGGGTVAELRPMPAYEPIELVKNIRNAMLMGIDKSPAAKYYEWKAGGMVDGCCIGGHIHFGNKIGKFPHRINIRALDHLLAQTVILLEDPVEARDRRQSYGQFGEHRDDHSHGTEYRSCSSWLTSPYIALGVLSLAKAIAVESLMHGLTEENMPDNVKVSPTEYNGCKMKVMRDRMPTVYECVKKLDYYKKYAPAIDMIFDLVKNKKTWFPNIGMKAAWGIGSSKEHEEKDYIPKLTLKQIFSGI